MENLGQKWTFIIGHSLKKVLNQTQKKGANFRKIGALLDNSRQNVIFGI